MEIKNEIFSKDSQKYTAYLIDESGNKIENDISDFMYEFISQNKLIGNITHKFISFTLFNASKYNLADKKVKVYIVFEDGDRTLKEEQYIGQYIINKSAERDRKRDEIKLEGEDFLYFYNKKYKIDLKPPFTIKDLIEEIKKKENILIEYKDIKNLDYLITGDVYYEDEKLTALIKQIAEATASNVYLDFDNKLIFRSILNNDSFNLFKSDIFELVESDREVKGYNVITASRIDTDKGTTTEDVFYTKLTENELKDKEKVEEYKLLANQIIDRDRQAGLPEIYEALKNINYIGVEMELKGAPFLIPYTKILFNNKTSYIQDFNLNLKNGLSKINCKIETKTETDYKKATVRQKNLKTEIFVDKTKGEIKSLIDQQTESREIVSQTIQTVGNIKNQVSSVEEKGNTLEKKYTELNQNIDNLTIEVKSTGGSNLIKNSVLFNDREENGVFVNWKNKTGDWYAKESTESLNYGGVSGRVICNESSYQSASLLTEVPVKVNNSYSNDQVFYSLSFRVKKGKAGTFKITLKGKENIYRDFTLAGGEDAYFTEVKLEKIRPTENIMTITIEINGGYIEITDLMLNVGTAASSWTTHVSESVSQTTVVDNRGLTVQTSGYKGKTVIDGGGLSGYYENNRVFGIREDLTESKKFKAENEIGMVPIKIIPVPSGIMAGWHFVKNE